MGIVILKESKENKVKTMENRMSKLVMLPNPDRNLIEVIRQGKILSTEILYIGVIEDLFTSYILDSPIGLPIETWEDPFNGIYPESVLGDEDSFYKNLRMACQALKNSGDTLGEYVNEKSSLVYIDTNKLINSILENRKNI